MATRAEWIGRVRRCEQSGLDTAEFARREGLEPAQLEGWCRKLRGTEPQDVEPQSRAMPIARACPASPTPAPAWIDIALPDGSLVRLLPGVDAGTLASVLAVVAELASERPERGQSCASPLRPSGAVRK